MKLPSTTGGQDPDHVVWRDLISEWNKRELEKIRRILEHEFGISRSDLDFVCYYDEPKAPDGDGTGGDDATRRSLGAQLFGLTHRKRIEPGTGRAGETVSVVDAIDQKWEYVWQLALERGGDKSALVAYFVLAVGMKKWELSSDHSAVLKSVEHAHRGYLRASVRDDGDGLGNESRLAWSMLNELAFWNPAGRQVSTGYSGDGKSSILQQAMDVESAVYAGSPEAAMIRAKRVVTHCNDLLEGPLKGHDGGDSCGDIRSFFGYLVNLHKTYYDGIARAAEAVKAAGEIDLTARVESTAGERIRVMTDIDEVMSALSTARANLGDDVYASEIPPYLAMLQAWRSTLDPRHAEPIAALESLNFTYIYPFALYDVDVDEVQKFLRELVFDDESKTLHAPAVKGPGSVLEPAEYFYAAAKEVELNDLWTWGGRRKELNATICLPVSPITVRLHDDDNEWQYTIDLLFNDLGNHYLRAKLRSPKHQTVHEINQALRRATTYCGDHEISYIGRDGQERSAELGGDIFTTIADYAKVLIDEVSAWVVREANIWSDAKPDAKTRDAIDNWGKKQSDNRTKCYESGFEPDFDYHLLVLIGGATNMPSPDTDQNSMQTVIENGYGDLMMQLLNREATTLDEWICRGRIGRGPNLLGEHCFAGDFAIGTTSTTVLYMPATPSWVQNGYIEVAEFAASFRPLLNESKKNLEDKIAAIEDFIQADEDKNLEEQEIELRYRRRDLHRLLDRMRQIRTYLVPAHLLSLQAEGDFLARLYLQQQMPKLTEELDGYLERGRIAIDRMNRRESRLHDHRSRHSQDTIQNVLLIVGVLSFSGVISLVLTMAYGADMPGWFVDPKKDGKLLSNPWDEINIAVAIVAYIFVIFLIAVYVKRAWVKRQLKKCVEFVRTMVW